MNNYILLAIIYVVISNNLSFAETFKPCSKKDAIMAEEVAAKATNWEQLYKLYKLYNQCDDGAIAEGFSESVSIVLSSYWEQVSNLLAIVRKDAQFEAFVLSHLDETVPEERLQLIANLASNSCPNFAKNLCDKILSKLSEF